MASHALGRRNIALLQSSKAKLDPTDEAKKLVPCDPAVCKQRSGEMSSPGAQQYVTVFACLRSTVLLKITLSTPRLSTTCTAFDEVQVMSLSAFTSAEVLT